MNLPHLERQCPDQCICELPTGCICEAAEKTLRAYQDHHDLPPMSQEMREECLKEIDCVEGYSRVDYETASDSDLATGVITAWTDFARDKGLL